MTPERFLTEENIAIISPKFDDFGYNCGEEFSWSSCECCGCTLGGTRVTLEARHYDNHTRTSIDHQRISEYDVCIDCFEELAM